MAVGVTDGYDATVCAAAHIASYTLLVCAIYEMVGCGPVYSKETYIRTVVANTTNHRTENSNTARVVIPDPVTTRKTNLNVISNIYLYFPSAPTRDIKGEAFSSFDCMGFSKILC